MLNTIVFARYILIIKKMYYSFVTKSSHPLSYFNTLKIASIPRTWNIIASERIFYTKIDMINNKLFQLK